MKHFEKVKSFLEGLPTIAAQTSAQDGRINSIEDEETIIKIIKANLPDNFSMEIAPPRFWYDIAIYVEDEFYPINIKSTTGGSTDNISSKEGMYYTLTGRDPRQDKVNTFSEFNRKLVLNYSTETDCDYYFLVFFKNSGALFFSSLKRIQTLVSNGNNLPFQCRWNSNLEYSDRSAAAQCEYIMNTYIESFTKRCQGMASLLAWRDTNET